MTVLVTGAGGWVGSALCRRLHGDGVPLRAVVRAAGDPAPPWPQRALGELGADTHWAPALEGVQAVVHLAARVHVMVETAPEAALAYRRHNLELTYRLAEAAAAAGVRRFVLVSTVKVHGESSPPGHAWCESDPPRPQDAYARSKLEAEQALQAVCQRTGMDYVIVRPPLVYGPGVRANFAALVRAVRSGWPLPLGAVRNQRSLVALDNLVDFLALCLRHPLAANQIFLVSDAQPVATPELLRQIAAAAGTSARLLPAPVAVLRGVGRLLGRSDQIDRLCGDLRVDSSKANSLLGWKPIVCLSEGLQSTLGGVRR